MIRIKKYYIIKGENLFYVNSNQSRNRKTKDKRIYIKLSKNRKEEIRGIVPLELGSYKVFDINDYSDDELIKQPGILTKVLSLEKAKNSIQVEKKTNIIAKCNLNEKEKAYLRQYIRYIIGEAYGKDETNKLLKKINKNVKEEKSMLIDVLYQVEARGEARGEKRGRIKEKAKIKAIAKELLKRGMQKEDVANIVHLNVKELEDI